MEVLTPISLKREGDALAISWSNGKATVTSWRALRKACPCAACNDERAKPVNPLQILSERELAAGAPAPVQMIPKGRYAYLRLVTGGTNLETPNRIRQFRKK